MLTSGKLGFVHEPQMSRRREACGEWQWRGAGPAALHAVGVRATRRTVVLCCALPPCVQAHAREHSRPPDRVGNARLRARYPDHLSRRSVLYDQCRANSGTECVVIVTLVYQIGPFLQT